jgi:flavin reductase (DIM6/NTAB) family NADH-FMN oxidoreductase RutF
MDAQAYRAIMRHQAGAVTIIAVGEAGNRTGLTATAVCSLTDNPPTVLACVNRNASAHKPIRAVRVFSINLLARDQLSLAASFSGKAGLEGEERFRPDEWTTLATGAPVLKNALASLDCELTEEHEFMTHSIFIGRVKDGRHRDHVEPLLYFRGDFWDLKGR